VECDTCQSEDKEVSAPHWESLSAGRGYGLSDCVKSAAESGKPAPVTAAKKAARSVRGGGFLVEVRRRGKEITAIERGKLASSKVGPRET
jgi:hypothetical protein